MIITGDPSQVDLPPGQTSGLAEAVRLLADVEGIGQVVFTHKDVIRHDLVAKIVAAYDRPPVTRPSGKMDGKVGEKTDGKASGQE
jgi:phosphate starvation-inducible protein PhoH and related proteins